MVRRVLVGIDRDGTINKDSGFFGSSENWKDELEIHEGVVEGIKLLNECEGLKIVVATDQGSGVSRGIYDLNRINKVNKEIWSVLVEKGIKIDSWQSGLYVGYDYAKKHKIENYLENKWVVAMDDVRLRDRKPGIGMLEKGCKEIGCLLSDFDKIYYIGDRIRDVETGVNAGGKGILVYNGLNGEAVEEIKSCLDSQQVVVDNFYEACKLIVDGV